MYDVLKEFISTQQQNPLKAIRNRKGLLHMFSPHNLKTDAQ
jgi:hypothetical protein